MSHSTTPQSSIMQTSLAAYALSVIGPQPEGFQFFRIECVDTAKEAFRLTGAVVIGPNPDVDQVPGTLQVVDVTAAEVIRSLK